MGGQHQQVVEIGRQDRATGLGGGYDESIDRRTLPCKSSKLRSAASEPLGNIIDELAGLEQSVGVGITP